MLKIEAAFLDMLRVQNMHALMRAEPRRRRSRRLAMMGMGMAQVVGTITAVSGLKTKHSISGSLIGTATVSGDTPPSVPADRILSSTTWTYNTTGADTINQFISVIFTATKNATTTLDLTGVLAGSFGELLATFTIVRKINFQYLTLAQDAVNGSASGAVTPVTIQPSAANPWITSPLGAAEIYSMKPGAKWDVEDHSADGMIITAGTGDKLDFIHGVNDFDAKFRITIFGQK